MLSKWGAMYEASEGKVDLMDSLFGPLFTPTAALGVVGVDLVVAEGAMTSAAFDLGGDVLGGVADTVGAL